MPTDVRLTAEHRGALRVHVVTPLEALGVDVFVTAREGGVSAAPYDTLNLGEHVGDVASHVEENRRRVAHAAGVARLALARQVHGAHVVAVDAPAVGLEADGLVTDSADLALAVLVADCVPLAIVDPATGRVGVVHAGWRGLAGGVIDAALAHFARPEDLHVVLGPSISPERYQVGPEVTAHFSAVPDAIVPDGGDRSRLDLRRVAASQLVAAGVRDERILITREVTDGGEAFFSDRAQRPCGRFALVARARSMRTP